MHILLIEDDQKAARLLARGLQEEGFEVAVAHSAEEAHASLLATSHLVILDWMLPGKDGIAVCRELRERDPQLPILMLTARDATADRIAGLNTGADDYLTKPFVFDELLAASAPCCGGQGWRTPRSGSSVTSGSIRMHGWSRAGAMRSISRPRNTPSSNA